MAAPAFREHVARRSPDPSSAMMALRAASVSLASAKELYTGKRYHDAFEMSRDAIRLASSALMFRDGCICGTLDASAAYLLERYPGAFPVDGWKRIEEFQSGYGSGLLALILRLLGKVKNAGEQEADEALEAASAFIASAREELVL